MAAPQLQTIDDIDDEFGHPPIVFAGAPGVGLNVLQISGRAARPTKEATELLESFLNAHETETG